MVLLCCEILRQYRNQVFSPRSSDAGLIVEILEYIEKNYLTATLESTARHFGFHPNYLSAYIKRQAGRSFKELLILQRMYQACFLLSNTELPIYEIACPTPNCRSTRSLKRWGTTTWAFSTISSKRSITSLQRNTAPGSGKRNTFKSGISWIKAASRLHLLLRCCDAKQWNQKDRCHQKASL